MNNKDQWHRGSTKGVHRWGVERHGSLHSPETMELQQNVAQWAQLQGARNATTGAGSRRAGHWTEGTADKGKWSDLDMSILEESNAEAPATRV